MSLAVLRSRALAGMEAPAVSVEVHLANGLPGLTMVGSNAPGFFMCRERL
jgi:magnesium chelatase family protein